MGKVKCKRYRTRRCTFERQFQKACRCQLHDIVTDSESDCFMHNTKKGKDFKKASWLWLVEHGYVSRKDKWICNMCMRYAEKEMEVNVSCEERSGGVRNCAFDVTYGVHGLSNSAGGVSNGGNGVCNSTADVSNGADGVSNGGNGVCDSADDLSNFIEESASEVDEDITLKEQEDLVHSVMKLIKERKLNDDLLSQLAGAIGTSLQGQLLEDSANVLHCYRDLTCLSKVDPNKFILERPEALVQFLLNITNVNLECDEKKILPMCLLLEQLMFLRHHNFIGPFSFANSLVKWSLTGSASVIKLDGAVSASGSLTTLKKVLDDSTGKTINECPEFDVDIFADNTQRVCRTSRVRKYGTTPVDVATNVVFINHNPPSNVQQLDDLKPEKWMPEDKFGSDVTSAIENVEKDLHVNYFRPYRYHFQRELVKQVKEELKTGEDHVTKFTRIGEDKKSDVVVCPKCAKSYPKVSNVCKYCKYNAHVIVDRNLLYSGVASKHPQCKASVKMGEIIAANPNSKTAIKHVLTEIKKQGELGEKRKWVRVGFDGVPYNIALGLMESLVVCEVCEAEVERSKFESHVLKYHADLQNVAHKKVFGDLLLVPGAGHMEINMLRAFFSLCKEFCLNHAASCLGFCSKKATEYLTNGVNHHLTWQVLNIVFEAFALELVWVYVNYYVQRNEDASVKSFVTWKINNVKSATYIFVYDLIFHFYTAFKLFRGGVRKNNSSSMLAGRQALCPLMYAGKHPIYQKILYNDMVVRVCAPEILKEYICRNESFSATGDSTKGEGGDYLTEGENRGLKSHLPPGKPTLELWQQSSRCHSKLQVIRQNVFCNAHIQDPGTEGTSNFNFDLEVQMYRAKIRQSGILLKPTQKKGLQSIEKKALHPKLINLLRTCKNNYRMYKEEASKADLQPVFVTEQDEKVFQDVTTWSMEKIRKNIVHLIGEMDTETGSLFEEIYTGQISKLKKNDLINFLQEVRKAADICKARDGAAGNADVLDVKCEEHS